MSERVVVARSGSPNHAITQEQNVNDMKSPPTYTASARFPVRDVSGGWTEVYKNGALDSTWAGWPGQTADLPQWFEEMRLEIDSEQEATDESGAVIGVDYTLRRQAR